MFVGRFLTDVTDIEADTSARINIEVIQGKVTGTATARRNGSISLPNQNVRSD